VGVVGIVLAGAPAGFAEAALVEARHLAVARERFGDADPIVGVEVVGAVHEQDGRSPARAEGAVEDRYVAGIHPSVALHGWRLLVLSWLASLSHRRALRHAAARAGSLRSSPRKRGPSLWPWTPAFAGVNGILLCGRRRPSRVSAAGRADRARRPCSRARARARSARRISQRPAPA